MRHRMMISAPLALVLALGATAWSPAYAQRQSTLPAGSVLKVLLDDALSSDHNQPGDRFTATVETSGTRYNLPAGTRVDGVVTQVQQASSNQPGTLDVQFNDLRLPDGQTYRIAGAPISLDSKSVQQTSSGQLIARPEHRNDRTKFIAYGAGAGLLIGSLLGSNIKGALAGAAAGYLYGRFNKNKGNGHEVVLKPGTEFGVRLDQRVALASTPGYGNGYGRRLSNRYGYGRTPAGYGRTTATASAYGASEVVLPEG